MTVPRRRFLYLAASAMSLPAGSPIASAQPYPARLVRLIVQTPAGGSPDIIGRIMAQWLSERLGQPFVVENRAGASGNIATEAVLRAPADGYSLLLAMSANAINASVYDDLRFNFIKDAEPVASIGKIPLLLEVNPAVPAKTVPELIAYVKANPGKINMAASGTGTDGRPWCTATGACRRRHGGGWRRRTGSASGSRRAIGSCTRGGFGPARGTRCCGCCMWG